jgi:hypothetical protein
MKPIISQAELDKFFEGCKTPDEKFSRMITAMVNTPPHPMKKHKPPNGNLGKVARSKKLGRYAFFTVRFLDTK